MRRSNVAHAVRADRVGTTPLAAGAPAAHGLAPAPPSPSTSVRPYRRVTYFDGRMRWYAFG